ncbi:MAG: hypothetical protein HQL93_07865 [Magnetococcales bacterium]|nr:hypothetical protein [Magnetococcales bacterium]
MAFLSYMSILCLVPLIFASEDEYIHFHARQGLVLWVWGLLAIVALHLPGLGPFFFGVSVILISVFSLIGMVGVLLSRYWKLPLVWRLAAKL